MPDLANQKWNDIFGKAWAEVANLCPEIGAYLLDHRERKVILDPNAGLLFEMELSPDYDSMLDRMEEIASQRPAFSMLTTTTVYEDETATAGIVRWHYDFTGAQAKDILSMCDRAQMYAMMSRCKTPSVFALLEFSISDHSALTDAQLFGVLAVIIDTLPDETVLCANHRNCFRVFIPDFTGDAEALLREAQQKVIHSGQALGFSAETKDRYITFTAGVGVDEGAPEQRMSTALFALYEANLSGAGSIQRYSPEQYEVNKVEYEKMSRFLRLINESLFQYHFQPIVSAKTGEIVAYEMLMRTDPSINMAPLEILDCAEKAQRLYDVEKATIENALAIIEQHQDIFQKRKLFVNSITAHMLTDADWNELASRYGELMEKMVIEFTEQSELDTERIDNVRHRLLNAHMQIAIDDFGTGYSNTMNLLRYNPDCVKIDRSLISGIDTKPTLRKLVSGVIEFIHENGYQALAEGVETYEELDVMIQLGSDLIQGYYVSKPKPIMLYEVSDSIRKDIETINLMNSGELLRPYHPAPGETVDLVLIRSDGYNAVCIEENDVRLVGRPELHLDTMIMVKDGLACRLTLDNVKIIKTEKDAPLIALGSGSQVELAIEGENELNGHGIYVPESASLLLTGDRRSSLHINVINVTNDGAYAIGTGVNESPGEITVHLEGKLSIEGKGDSVIGIGGGKNASQRVVNLLGGEIGISVTGVTCLGVGTLDSGSIVRAEDCTLRVKTNAGNAVGLGSYRGATSVVMKRCQLHQNFSCVDVTGVGAYENGTGSVELIETTMTGRYMGHTVACIGTRSGNLACRMRQADITIYTEGDEVMGIGDLTGIGDVTAEQGRLDVVIKAGSGMVYGNSLGEGTRSQVDENLKISS